MKYFCIKTIFLKKKKELNIWMESLFFFIFSWKLLLFFLLEKCYINIFYKMYILLQQMRHSWRKDSYVCRYVDCIVFFFLAYIEIRIYYFKAIFYAFLLNACLLPLSLSLRKNKIQTKKFFFKNVCCFEEIYSDSYVIFIFRLHTSIHFLPFNIRDFMWNLLTTESNHKLNWNSLWLWMG
jgi:hypothetical protein